MNYQSIVWINYKDCKVTHKHGRTLASREFYKEYAISSVNKQEG